MPRRLAALLLLVSLPAFAAPPAPADDEVNAVALLAGAREVDASGTPVANSAAAFDGIAEYDHQWEPAKDGETVSAVIELAEPFDLTRAAVVNSLSEADYPGISTKRLRLEYGPAARGPWKPFADATLTKSKKPQPLKLTPVKAARFLRVTLLGNYGNEEWWSLAELQVFGRRSKPRPVDFNGAWTTTYGEMRLEQKGERVTGCWGSEESKAGLAVVEGTVEGPVFFGTYSEAGSEDSEPMRGTIAFALTAEGHLSGVWGSNPTGRDRSARWDGTRRAKSSIRCEKPQKDLGAELEKTGRLVLRGILFDTGKDTLRPESEEVLKALAAAMKKSKAKYMVEGHTDDRGGERLNQPLSERRAQTVKAWLVKAGIDTGRLSTRGFGQSRPALPNDSEAGRAANRRVEIAVEK